MIEFILGFVLAVLLIASILTKSYVLDKKDFQCTESAIVNGVAECVKYERKVER